MYCLITPSVWSVLVLVLVLVWPPQYHSPGQTGTIINDRVPPHLVVLPVPVLRSSISFSYTEKYSRIQREKRLYTIPLYGIRMWCPFQIVFLRIQSRRYTIVIRAQVILQNTVVYDCERIVDAHLRLYTETVILDLGCFIFYLSLLVKSYIM